jgi:Ca-activated chloride channel family protein
MDYTQDYYAILGVSPTANEEEIRQVYRTAARRFHPDVNKAVGVESIFQDINAAYEILSDPFRRSEYDQFRATTGSKAGSLIVDVLYSRHKIKPLAEPQLLYVLLTINPQRATGKSTEAPLNICLVVDRSKSMAGKRLQHVKAAANRIIDSCRPDDIFSMVVFSDEAEIIVPSQKATDPRAMKTMVSTIRADGATAIRAGLSAGVSQIERNYNNQYVNHLILITDGRTYGDEEECYGIAKQCRNKGIGISGMGIGDDWNDQFLDKLTNETGGNSAYISSPEFVTRFLEERIRSLAAAYAEHSQISVTVPTGVELKEITRLSPNTMTLPNMTHPLALGTLDGLNVTSLLFQFHISVKEATPGEFFAGRIDIRGEVLGGSKRMDRVIHDISIEITNDVIDEDPPGELLDALSKLMLYRLQERARDALTSGNIAEATRSLEHLATRLFEAGQGELGQAALDEIQQVASTQILSDEGAKRLKYGTRALFTSEMKAGDQDG